MCKIVLHGFSGILDIQNSSGSSLILDKGMYAVNPQVSKTKQTYQCPQDNKEVAYRGLVRPILEYGSCVWGPHW